MNYLKIYESIIQKAKFENRIKLKKHQHGYVYYEKHHIIPKCMNGTNNINNLVLLTAREHYVCHKLLIYIYPNNRGLILAIKRFIHSKKLQLYKISSRDYETMKKSLKDNPPKSHYQSWLEKFGKEEADKRHKEEKEKIKKTMTGVKYSEERRKKSAKGHVGIKQSEETKLKRNKSLKGKNTGPRSKEIKNKISNACKGKNVGKDNPRFGKSNYDIWVEKFGEEIAIQKHENWINNEKAYYYNKKNNHG
jgi:hypothetical protein